MIDARFRSLDTWPYESTPSHQRRTRWTFKASWESTLHLLDRELGHLGARDIVIECGLRAHEIRNDGWPRSNANLPSFPGVAVHFDAPELGHLRYSTDTCEFWQHNVRSIALGLQALRAVDRYGITRGGEQYRGFGELPSGIAVPAARMSVEQAATFITEHAVDGNGFGMYDVEDVIADVWYAEAYRAAARRLHPDAGGTVPDFQRLQEAKAVLDQYLRSAS